MADSSSYTPETLQRRYKLAEQLLGPTNKPVTHWAEGLNELAKGYFGGRLMSRADEEAKAGERAQSEAIARLLGGGSPSAAPAAPVSAPASAGGYGDAIAGIESGGKYDALGPETKTGDRAYGKYQVMGANVPEWTQAALGQQMTPDQFLQNPQAQDAVFKQRFGSYVDKYGPEGAAKAWFAGEGGMNNPNARDQLGTTVQGYADKFKGAMGPQVAQAAPANVSVPGIPGGGPSAIAAGDSRSRVAAMLNDPSPFVRQMGRQLGSSIIAKQLEGEKPTDEMREYDLYRRQGGKESFFDYKAGLKKAGAQNITIDQKGQTSFEQAAGTAQAKRFDDLAGEAPKAKQMLSDVAVLTDLGKNIGTGKSAEVKATLGPYADALGVKVNGLSDIQAFEAIVNRMAPNLRVPGSGAQSDYELRNFLKSLPNLGNTPEGNAIASSVMQGLYQNKIRAAEIGSKALNGQISRTDAEKALQELPDPMEAYREFMKKTRGASSAGGADAEWKDLGGGVRIREKK